MPMGPTGYSFTLDGYNASSNAVSAAESLDHITEFNGINEEAKVSDLTALGDDIMSEHAIGLSQFERITLKGYVEAGSSGLLTSSAFQRIGRPARRDDYPKRTLTVTHRTGLTQAIEVIPVKNMLITDKEQDTMFEAEFIIASRADSEYTETGFGT